jgi:GNAT superfamily N-acetyltransferase
MEYIRITEENIDREHICCAMSNNQSAQKKEWMKARFKDGLVFYRSAERGKCFIEYIPAENAWHPINAEGYMHIDCLWVSGSFKGHGYSNELLKECIRDAKAQGKKGLCILSSAKKKGFLADPKFLTHKGFKVADESDVGIQLWYLPFAENGTVPSFKDCAKHPKVPEKGLVIYYSDQCPFTYYWVPRLTEVAKENDIPLKIIYIDSLEAAQNAPSPVTNFTIFKDGKFLTHEIQSEKKFLTLAEKA